MLARPLDPIRRLRVTGWARYVDAAFLCLWLAIWAVGEAAALTLMAALLASAVSVALGRPLALASRVAPTDGTVSLFLLFLLLWTALWTVGGFAAAAHLLRRLSGEDLVDVSGLDVYLTRRAGPFRRRRRVPHRSIRQQVPGHHRGVGKVRKFRRVPSTSNGFRGHVFQACSHRLGQLLSYVII
jgi:hypothetical protein